MTNLVAPFPYFGGKSKVSGIVWDYLGQPKHYIEPFFGSGAVLLQRPMYNQTEHTETVCDKDGFISNVWRAIKYKPEETAEWCDWPVNHADLIARRKTLLANEENLLENLCKDDVWCDPKIAGYWIWAASCWIGSGLTRRNAIPHISDGGEGIHAKGNIPHISDGGNNENIYKIMSDLSDRLRYVRVVCGDWTRVCGGNWQERMGDCGIFFDPPYGHKDRSDVYHQESKNVSLDVENWCLDRGKNPKYKIVIAGYDGEYLSLVENGWIVVPWATRGGYANTSKNETTGDKNKKLERLFISPHCVNK